MPRKPLIKKLDLYSATAYGSSDPDSATNGDMFYNTTEATLKIWIDGAWTSISGSGGTPPGGTFDFMDDVDFQFMDDVYYDFMDA